jgi:DDE superfamily endonuclease
VVIFATPTLLFVALLSTFAPLLSDRVWRQAPVLLVGAILVPGQRTVTSLLAHSGIKPRASLRHYHRVLSRARRSGREASRPLLVGLLATRFAPAGPILLGIDTIKRRSKRIQAKDIYRNPVRSSHSHFVLWIPLPSSVTNISKRADRSRQVRTASGSRTGTAL